MLVSFRLFRWPFSTWRWNISVMSGTFISGFDRFSSFFEMAEIFVFELENHAKWFPRKNQDFLIYRFFVIIFYQLFESIQNHVVFYRCWYFYSNFALHAIYRPPWTRGEQRKFVDVSVAVTFATRSIINLVICGTSVGKYPTVRKNKRTNTY